MEYISLSWVSEEANVVVNSVGHKNIFSLRKSSCAYEEHECSLKQVSKTNNKSSNKLTNNHVPSHHKCYHLR